MLASIALFAFNRPTHLAKTLDALACNFMAKESALTLFCDGPRTESEREATDAVRQLANMEAGQRRFLSVRVIESPQNKGLAASIVGGVTQILKERDRVIVLEDDIITAPYFLQFMNDGLAAYEDNLRVASIQGYCFPHSNAAAPDTFFLRGADCWGWATWRRAWQLFEPDASVLLHEINKKKNKYLFDIDGTYPYTAMLQDQYCGKNDSWAIRWQASVWIKNMYSLYSSSSLVVNIGMDASGTHCEANSQYVVPLAQQRVPVVRIEPVASAHMYREQKKFYKKFFRRSFLQRVKGLLSPRLKQVLKRMLKTSLLFAGKYSSKIAFELATKTHTLLRYAQWGVPPTPRAYDSRLIIFYDMCKKADVSSFDRGVLSRLCMRKGRTLDIGCGDGFFTKHFLAKYSNTVLAYDIVQESIDNAVAYNNSENITYVCDDILRKFPEGNFDNVVANAVFEQISKPDLEELLSKIGACLAEAGIFNGVCVQARSDNRLNLCFNKHEFPTPKALHQFLNRFFVQVEILVVPDANRTSYYFFATNNGNLLSKGCGLMYDPLQEDFRNE